MFIVGFRKQCHITFKIIKACPLYDVCANPTCKVKQWQIYECFSGCVKLPVVGIKTNYFHWVAVLDAWICLVNERGQKVISRLVQANRKATLPQTLFTSVLSTKAAQNTQHVKSRCQRQRGYNSRLGFPPISQEQESGAPKLDSRRQLYCVAAAWLAD